MLVSSQGAVVALRNVSLPLALLFFQLRGLGLSLSP